VAKSWNEKGMTIVNVNRFSYQIIDRTEGRPLRTKNQTGEIFLIYGQIIWMRIISD